MKPSEVHAKIIEDAKKLLADDLTCFSRLQILLISGSYHTCNKLRVFVPAAHEMDLSRVIITPVSLSDTTLNHHDIFRCSVGFACLVDSSLQLGNELSDNIGDHIVMSVYAAAAYLNVKPETLVYCLPSYLL